MTGKIFYQDADGKTYKLTMAFWAKNSLVPRDRPFCAIVDGKLYARFNRAYYPQDLGLTKV